MQEKEKAKQKQKQQPEKVRQVFQGTYIRENASFWSKFTYSYIEPLLDSCLIQPICFEQYGILPERLRICHEEKKYEESIRRYEQKGKSDKFAFMKGILYANRWKLPKFFAIRIVLMINDLLNPLLLVSFITWIQD